MTSICGCALLDGPGRWPLRSAASPVTRRPRPGPGSTWRSRARAWSRPRRGSARGWRRSSAKFCSGRASLSRLPATWWKCAAPSPRKKATASAGTSNTPPADWSISSSSRSICNWCTRTTCPTFSTPRPRACSTRPGHCACCRSRRPRFCARRCSFIRTSRRSCGCAWRARSTPRPRAPGCCACSRAPPTCRISPRSMPR